ncbi:MAG: AMP-binding protein [Clostridia bacterium]|nr:AMP-binding protein [Clostridia bacterium]
MAQNILEWLEKTSENYPEKVAFEDTENSVTFAEILSISKSVGTALARHTSPCKPVAVLSGRHAFTPAVFLGAVYAGCFYAPLDGGMPDYRLNQIMGVLKPEIIVADSENFERAKALAPNCTVLISEEIAKTPVDENALSVIRKNAKITDPLYVIFTSGSSGIPKGVITSHESLMCYIEAYDKVMNITAEDVLGNQSPLDYIAAIRDIYLPLKNGTSTFIIPKQRFVIPTKLFDILNEKKITAIGWSVSALTVPTAMGVFKYSSPKYLKKICFSGSVMPCKYLKVWQENLPDALFVNQYGPTEATASCTYYVIKNKVEDDDILPIGIPYDNYTVFLLNDDNTATEQGKIGEICVSGPLAIGYYNDKERTEASFIQNPLNKLQRIYKTGDYGLQRADGNFEFHGRKDRQIKHLGHRVELDEIENAVKALENVSECAAIYNQKKEQIMLIYAGDATGKEIALEIRKKLPEFMLPRKTVKLAELPHLPNGKTDIKSIEEKYFK